MPALTAMRCPAERRPAVRRPAFTLLELTVAVLVAGVVCGAITSVLVRQQRFYQAAAATVAGREQVAQALAVLPPDLRALSPGDGDVTALAADSVQLRATIGGGIACAASGGGAALELPPTRLAAGGALVVWSAVPRAGDTLLVYDAGDSTRPASWSAHTVVAFDASTTYCGAASAFVAAADAGATRYQVRVDPATPLPATAGPGAAVRLLRHVRYKLYEASDAHWYLGYSDYRAGGGWATVQPVSGPYAPRGGTPFFRFQDAQGAPVDDRRRSALARVTITARALAVPLAGGAPARPPADSLSVAVRNPNE